MSRRGKVGVGHESPRPNEETGKADCVGGRAWSPGCSEDGINTYKRMIGREKGQGGWVEVGARDKATGPTTSEDAVREAREKERGKKEVQDWGREASRIGVDGAKSRFDCSGQGTVAV